MTLTTDTRVLTLVDLLDDDGSIVPEGSKGTVIAYRGEQYVVEFHDQETDTRQVAVAEIWELRSAQRRNQP